jgi:hypothetical protein
MDEMTDINPPESNDGKSETPKREFNPLAYQQAMMMNTANSYKDFTDDDEFDDEPIRRMVDAMPEMKELLKIHKFSEFAKDALIIESVPLRKVLGYPIVVTSYEILPSRFKVKDKEGRDLGNKEYVKIHFFYVKDRKQRERITNTSSNVIRKQLDKYASELPFMTCIRLKGACFTFS